MDAAMQCEGLTKSGSRCKNKKCTGTNFCHQHGGGGAKVRTDGSPSHSHSHPDVIVNVENGNDLVANAEINARIAKLKAEIKELQKLKRSFKGNKVLNKAKLIFYHDNKNNQDILDNLRKSLSSANLLATRMVKGVSKEIIPWHFVKICTDQLFASASVDVRNQYMDMARMELHAATVNKLNP